MKTSRERIEALTLKTGNRFLRPFYKIYEKWLWLQIKNGPFPNHVGIIPDGNRRWAKRVGLDPSEGHVFGYEKIKETLRWIWDLGIKHVTIYAMSTENCRHRPPQEREKLFNLAFEGLKELKDLPEIHEYKVKVKIIGDYTLVPADLINAIRELEEKTKDYHNYSLNIALCYGGRQEILDAIKKVLMDLVAGKITLDELTEENFRKYLYTNNSPDPDLIIRTSGEERISNFLLWQSAYSELYFCDVYWPEFRKIDFWRAIRSYQFRERRFGR
ncbi:MAG: polyprenyl diphosphate synthase [Thermosphaera sp.]